MRRGLLCERDESGANEHRYEEAGLHEPAKVVQLGHIKNGEDVQVCQHEMPQLDALNRLTARQ